ncbi:hypothetical protein M3Y98_00428600 [Aphelenchoides besseyi]|nr:hypothetical protein M3Y98_00428600 [Aphelenchoides besseyi]KAI6202279.1 hypothetical protein M3Y96_00931300 [Aphelenchoides besseyi]
MHTLSNGIDQQSMNHDSCYNAEPANYGLNNNFGFERQDFNHHGFPSHHALRPQLSFGGEATYPTYQAHPIGQLKSLPEQSNPYYYNGPAQLDYQSDMFNGSQVMMTTGQRQPVRQNNNPIYPLQQPNTHVANARQQPRQRQFYGQQPQMLHSNDPSTSYQPQQIMQQTLQPSSPSKRKEIYVYNSPFDLYAMAWSMRPGSENKYRLAIGSFMEEYNNKISIVQLREDYGCEFLHLGTFDHPYPATKLMFIPDRKGIHPDLIATTGDYLRLWSVGGSHGATLEAVLDNNRSSHYCAPLTSADWNEVDPSLIATASIDTTCTIWEVETGKAVTERKLKGDVKTQLIAHDREVYDISFSKLHGGKDIFGSVGADGSVRMFDCRHMEYSMIVFEEPNRNPLLRIQFNQQDHNYLATFAQNSSEVFIIDIRIPSIPVAVLKNHSGPVNAINWAPHSSCHICTVAEDKQALIWDVHSMPRPVDDPILAYGAKGEINQIQWSSTLTDWIAISYGKTLELLRGFYSKMTSYNVGLQAFINDQAKVKEEQFIEHIREHDVFKLGDFVLKSGFRSPIYIDFRGLISSPRLMNETAYLVREVIEKANVDYEYVVGVPFAALSLGSRVSLFTNKPMLMNRPQAKAYGTKKLIEGVYDAGKRALIVEDVVTTGASIQETAKALRNEGLIVEDVVCVLNREQGGMEALKEAGIRLHSVLKVSQILEHLEQVGQIDADKHKEIREKLKNPEKAAAAQSNGASGVSWRLDNRAELLEKHPLNRTLLSLIKQKQSNLCVALDLKTAADVIATIEQIKDHICAVKLHVDSLTDATVDFFSQLRQLADQSGFVIFEDRKFADTGNTNLLQLTGGTYRIADWADLVTAHSTPGSAAIQSFETAICDKTSKISGVLLVAEMSSEGTLTSDAEYVRKTVEIGKKCSNVVSGFICQKRCADEPRFLYWTPGVNLSQSTDGKGQHWRGVKEAIVDDGNDIVIVGRGITNAKDIKAEAKRYQEAAWATLQSRE